MYSRRQGEKVCPGTYVVAPVLTLLMGYITRGAHIRAAEVNELRYGLQSIGGSGQQHVGRFDIQVVDGGGRCAQSATVHVLQRLEQSAQQAQHSGL